jgi:alpha-ribazole phosphatase/probable phosphoglycerate mutase
MSTSVTRLYLIRHGQVDKVRPRSYNGQSDVPLSPLGRQQMERLADWAASTGLSAVYCSDLQRTRQGADVVGRRCAVPVSATPLLREKHFGRWEGLTYEEAEEQFPVEWRAWLADPSAARPPEGETYREVEARVVPFVRRLVLDHAGQSVLILAHGGVNRVIVCRALGLPMQRVFGIEQDYACVNRIDCSAGGRWQVAVMNSALPGDPLVTVGVTAASVEETNSQAGKTG